MGERRGGGCEFVDVREFYVGKRTKQRNEETFSKVGKNTHINLIFQY